MCKSATGSVAGADLNEFPLSELVEELDRRTRIQPGEQRPPLVLFETPFGRRHRATGADLLVWVDTPLELALSRTILKFLVAAQGDQTPNAVTDFVQWKRQSLLNYEAVRPMYRAQ
jgi:uridine kinase